MIFSSAAAPSNKPLNDGRPQTSAHRLTANRSTDTYTGLGVRYRIPGKAMHRWTKGN